MKAKLAFTFVTLLSTAAFAQDYAVRFHRPEKPGDEYKISSSGQQSMATNVTVNGVVQKDEKKDLATQFEGTEKIVEVDAKGKETKVMMTVNTFTITADGTSSQALPNGTVITVSEVDRKKVFEVDGKAIDDPATVRALGMVVELSKNDDNTDDDLFGTTDRKKKGDTWDINTAKAQESLQSAADGAVVSDLAGKMKLDDVAGDSMTVSGHITGSLKPPLPPIFTFDSSTLDVVINGTFPVDVTKTSPARDSETVSFSFSAHGDAPQGGGTAVIKSSFSQSTDRKLTPLK